MGDNDEYSARRPSSGRSAVDPKKLERLRTGEREAVRLDPVKKIISQLEDLKMALQESSGDLTPEQSTAVKKWDRYQKIGAGTKLVVTTVIAIFGAGITWQLWMTSNATDAEVKVAVKAAVIDHNGGFDPDAVNEAGQPIGDHPDMRKAIDQSRETIKTLTDAVGDIQDELPKIDMRGEYQFEFARWQADTIECERKRCKYPPAKPERLKELERKLMFGNYGDSKSHLAGDQ